MNAYIKKPTQEERILGFLQWRGNKGVFAWEITNDLHILQYNARIYGLREKGHDIVSVTPGHFKLIKKGQQTL